MSTTITPLRDFVVAMTLLVERSRDERALLAEQLRYMVVWNRGPLEWGVTAAATLAMLGCCATSGVLLARRLTGTPAAGVPWVLPGIAPVLREWIRRGRDPGLAGWASVLHGAVLLAGAGAG